MCIRDRSKTVKGIIVRNYSSNNSNWRSSKNFNQWLLEKNVIGLYGIDTRALVKILRSNGSMNGVLTSEDKSVENCLEIISSNAKDGGVEFIKRSFNKTKIFMAEAYRNRIRP